MSVFRQMAATSAYVLQDNHYLMVRVKMHNKQPAKAQAVGGNMLAFHLMVPINAYAPRASRFKADTAISQLRPQEAVGVPALVQAKTVM